MKKSILNLSALLLMIVIVVQSCKKDEDEEPTPTPIVNEFIADASTFADFSTWSLDATNLGADPGLGSTHGGNDSTTTRNVYFKNGQDPINGVYPLGTVIVKHSTNPGGLDERTAMVKRGNNFNPTSGDWEYFILDTDSKIAVDNDGNKMRGAQLLNGMCAGCHSQASSKDFIFSK